MTAPARRVTREQLLVLADRAERGRLTPAEADRLRAGITAAYASRKVTAGLFSYATRQHKRSSEQLAAVRALIRASQRQGLRTVRITTLAVALQETPPEGLRAPRTSATASGP